MSATLESLQIRVVKLAARRLGARVARSGQTVPIGRLGESGDVGFHIVGDQFNGSAYYPNLVPANGALNAYPFPPNTPTLPDAGGAWGQLEWEWADAASKGKTVDNVIIDLLQYPASSNLRPDLFSVSFSINRRRFEFDLQNNSRQPRLPAEQNQAIQAAIGGT